MWGDGIFNSDRKEHLGIEHSKFILYFQHFNK